MSSNKPWRVVKRANQLGIRALAVTDDTQGNLWEPRANVITEAHVATAQRFAASADLLAAADAALLALAANHPPGKPTAAMVALSAAIAKARGVAA